jgi:menaquinone-dependent protoporphyrinogen IX oxidase
MRHIAMVYDTVSGSTADMGAIIAEELQQKYAVTTLPIGTRASLEPYDAVLIGSPMRFGWCTSKVRAFLKRHRPQLVRKKVAFFFSTLYAVRIAEEPADEGRLFFDPGLAIATIPRKTATGMDRTHSLGYYERRRRHKAPDIDPLSIAYFKGRLVLDRLPLPARLFMKVVTMATTKEQEGEFLNPAAVRAWAEEMACRL